MQAVQGTAQLAPSRSFARALLGAVGPATAEQIKRSKGKVALGDDVGQWGLEARYQDQLAGTPTRRIVIRDRSGAPIATLLQPPGPARGASCARRSTATSSRRPRTALGDSEGEVRAGRRAALDGRHPRRGQPPDRGHLRPRDRRPLPARLDVQGRHHRGAAARRPEDERHRRLPEDDHGRAASCSRTSRAGRPAPCPSPRDFAQSCNTAFVSLAERLAPDALPRTARDFGLGRTERQPGPAPAATRVARAATMIGQDRIVASPLAMAGVAATVADGRWHAPRLVDERRAPHGHGAGRRRASRPCATLMRSVVTSGTGTALAVGARRGRGQERHRRVRRRRPAADARLVHRLPRRPRHRRPRRERAAPAARSPRRSPSASSTRWGRERELSSAGARGASAALTASPRGSEPTSAVAARAATAAALCCTHRPGPWRPTAGVRTAWPRSLAARRPGRQAYGLAFPR